MATILVTSRSFGEGAVDLVGDLQRAGHTVLRGPSDHDPAVTFGTARLTTRGAAGSDTFHICRLGLSPVTARMSPPGRKPTECVMFGKPRSGSPACVSPSGPTRHRCTV